jgi:hypothetical protein
VAVAVAAQGRAARAVSLRRCRSAKATRIGTWSEVQQRRIQRKAPRAGGQGEDRGGHGRAEVVPMSRLPSRRRRLRRAQRQGTVGEAEALAKTDPDLVAGLRRRCRARARTQPRSRRGRDATSLTQKRHGRAQRRAGYGEKQRKAKATAAKTVVEADKWLLRQLDDAAKEARLVAEARTDEARAGRLRGGPAARGEAARGPADGRCRQSPPQIRRSPRPRRPPHCVWCWGHKVHFRSSGGADPRTQGGGKGARMARSGA